MINQIKLKLEEFIIRKKELNPEIEKIKSEREQEIKKINQKYEKKISALSSDLERFRKEISNDMINSLIDAVMQEFDAKRSTSEYSLTEGLKEYRNEIASFEMFPSELIQELDKVISGDQIIENIAYNLEEIKKKYLKPINS